MGQLKSPEESLLSRRIITRKGCWVLPGKQRNLCLGGKYWKASRLGYTLWKGKIPRGQYVLHDCDNPRCFNPEHLHLGTQQQNMTEAKERGRLVTPAGWNRGMDCKALGYKWGGWSRGKKLPNMSRFARSRKRLKDGTFAKTKS